MIAPGVDVRGDGGMVVAPPSVTSKGEYRWVDEGAPIANAPSWLMDLAKDSGGERRAPDAAWNNMPPTDPGEIAAALAAIPNDDPSWSWWNRVAMAVWSATSGGDDGFAMFDDWSRKWPGYSAKDTADRWQAISRSPPSRISAGTLFYMADEAAPGWRNAAEAAAWTRLCGGSRS